MGKIEIKGQNEYPNYPEPLKAYYPGQGEIPVADVSTFIDGSNDVVPVDISSSSSMAAMTLVKAESFNSDTSSIPQVGSRPISPMDEDDNSLDGWMGEDVEVLDLDLDVNSFKSFDWMEQMQEGQEQTQQNIAHQQQMHLQMQWQQQQQVQSPVILSHSAVIVMMCGNCTSTENIEVCPSPSQVYQYTCSNCRVVQTFNLQSNLNASASSGQHQSRSERLISLPPPTLSMDMELNSEEDEVVIDM